MASVLSVFFYLVEVESVPFVVCVQLVLTLLRMQGIWTPYATVGGYIWVISMKTRYES